MAPAQLGAVLRHIRCLGAAESTSGQSDGALLRAFAADNDQAAFTVLVQRHGPMVMSVCRRVLHNLHDAEDAFQATFLLLARNASSIRKVEALAAWLHGVAYRMAKEARRAAFRRCRHEGRAQPMHTADPECDLMWREVQTILDEEIQRLPAIYQNTFVLCCLENKSGAEAARTLGVKEGTVRSRLAKARALLQKSLARRGVSLSAVLAAAALTVDTAKASVSRSLIISTVDAATLIAAGKPLLAGWVSAGVITLLKGAKMGMFLGKLKALTLIFLGLQPNTWVRFHENSGPRAR